MQPLSKASCDNLLLAYCLLARVQVEARCVKLMDELSSEKANNIKVRRGAGGRGSERVRVSSNNYDGLSCGSGTV